jgi:DNA polymerase sigma
VRLAGWGGRNSEGLGALLGSFFLYYATLHDYRNQVVSIRSSSLVTKPMKGW